MDNNIACLLALGVFGAMILVTIAITVVVCKGAQYVQDKKFENFEKLYPEYFAEIVNYNNYLERSCAFWNTEIASRHRKINRLEESKKYLPMTEVEKVNTEIETLKIEAFNCEKVYYKEDAEMRKNHKEAMERIIVEENVPEKILKISCYGEEE